MAKNDNSNGLILEDFDSKFDRILESFASIKINTDTIPSLHVRLAELELKVSTLEHASKATGKDLGEIKNELKKLSRQSASGYSGQLALERRITRLENLTA